MLIICASRIPDVISYTLLKARRSIAGIVSMRQKLIRVISVYLSQLKIRRLQETTKFE